MTLRSRYALHLAAALLLCAPLTACDDKKAAPARAYVGGPAARATGAIAEAPALNPNQPRQPETEPNTENYQHFVENAYVSAEKEPRSTFSASVDTAAYTIIRSKIQNGQLPPQGAVRVADMLNYFDYEYPQPRGNEPVAATLEMAPCPWNKKHHLLRIALAEIGRAHV